MFTAPLDQLIRESPFPIREEVYYRGLFDTLHPDKNGFVGRESLAAFLQTSRVPEGHLHKIWGLVDLTERGLFNFDQFAKACRLVGHAQHGATEMGAELLHIEPVKLAVFGGLAYEPVHSFDGHSASGESAYEDIFRKLRVGSIIPPDAVRAFFVKSGLAEKDLAKIFDLSTGESSGVMGYGEFLVAMSLVNQSRQGLPIPASLTPDLVSLMRTPTPVPAANVQAKLREMALTELKNNRQAAVAQNADVAIRDFHYYKKFDEMKRLETALTMAKAVTVNWQDQILASQGRIGEIEYELEDITVIAEHPEEDVDKLEQELRTLQTELDKVNRQKSDLRMRVQVNREKLLQRGNDATLLSNAVSADTTKLSDLRRERLKVMEISRAQPLIPGSTVKQVSRQLLSRRDAKGVRVGESLTNSSSRLERDVGMTRANPGWEPFEPENAGVIGLPTLRSL